jgi:hypothetical protein
MMPFAKTISSLAAVAGLLCFPSGFNQGQAQMWEDLSANLPVPLAEQQVNGIASDGTRLYLLGRRGVLVSENNGASFTVLTEVAGGGASLDQYVDRALSTIKFVNGEVWIAGSGVTDAPGQVTARLHRLTPGETVWRPSSTGFPIGRGSADDIAHDPVSGLYFLTHSTGQVSVSSDGGYTWEQRSNGLVGMGSPSSVLAIDGVFLTSRPLGDVLRSTNQGANWQLALQATQDGVRPMIAHQGRALLWRGTAVDFSDDSGWTWKRVAPALPGVTSPASTLSSDGTNLYIVTGGGLHPDTFAYSASGGLDWQVLTRDGVPPVSADGRHYASGKIIRHGNQLFVHGVTRNSSFQFESSHLFRLDVSSFVFRSELRIAIQPQGRGLLVGQTHQLKVYAAGEELSYQWQKDGEDLPGETGRTLTLANVALGDAGDYRVLVRSGGGQPLASAAATVTVFAREDGRWDPTFDQAYIGDGGKVHLRPDGGAIVVRSGATPLRIYRIGPEGGRLDSFSENTASANSLSNSFIDEEGRIVVGYKNSSSSTVVRRYESEDFDFISSLFLGPSGTDERVQDMIEIPGRGYLVVGSFSTAGGVERKNIALIGYDNVVVPDFPAGTGPDSSLNSVTLAADGNIYTVGLSLSAWGGVNIGRLARISPGGQVTAGASGLPTGYFTFVHALKDGRLLARYVSGGSPYLYALNPDGTRDASFNTANHTIPDIRGVAQQADGKLIIVGNFNAFGGVPAAGYVRLNLDGTVDETFHSATGFSHGVIDNVTYDPRGYLYLSSTSGSSSSTFQGFGSVGRGPVRIFATPADSGPGGGDTFADWPALTTLPAGQRGPDATPAGDDVKNIVKYALGVLPLESAAARLPVETTVEEGGQTYPAVTFVRSRNAPGVSIVVDAASTVEFNDDLGVTTVSVEDLGNGTERVTIRSNTSVIAQGLQFFRINVTQP